MKLSLISKTAAALGLVLCASGASALAGTWQFGIISDTQWATANGGDDGWNPDSVAADIIRQIDKEFIKKQVKLVISVGDQMDQATNASFDTRALYAQDLYNASIPYYSLRGNHDAGFVGSGTNQAYVFPQIVNGGVNNMTPSILNPAYIQQFIYNNNTSNGKDTSYTSAANYLTDTLYNNPPAISNGITFTAGSKFSYPATNCPPTGTNTGDDGVAGNNYSNQYGSNLGNGGLSYSFDFNNVRFVMVDQFVDTSAGGSTSATSMQQNWITGRISDSARPTQAFIFSHKNLLGGNHKDNLFGANTVSADPGDGIDINGNAVSVTGANIAALSAKQAAEDAFIKSMVDNNVRYSIGGHDHHHVNSLVKSPLSNNSVHELITQSASAKFYTPGAPYSADETSISEDLYEIGYYLFTVDGPRMTIDYYAVPVNASSTAPNPGYLPQPSGYGREMTPVLTGNWVKMLTTGYSLNGKEFLVAEGASYTGISDSIAANANEYGESGFAGTSLSILSGINNSTLKTHDGRKLTKAVNTGWAPAVSGATLSDIVTLWGLTDLGAIQTDTITVSVSLPTDLDETDLSSGNVCLGVQLPGGTWINAVDDNIVGGHKNFVYGAYRSTDGLGTYGIDPVTHTAWAVVNGDARTFAVINTPSAPLPWDFNGDGKVTTADYTDLAFAIKTGSTDPKFDLNGDGKVNSSDERWLTQHYTNVGGN